MKKHHGVVLLLLCVLLFLIPGEGKGTFTTVASKEPFFPVGEELLYEVSWWKFKLGTIRTKILSVKKNNTDSRTHAIVAIDSYSWVPFVSLHVVFDVIMDEDCYSDVATALTKKESFWEFVRYRYDRTHHVLFIDRGRRFGSDTTTIVERIDSLPLPPHTQDGLSLVYFARKNLRSAQTIVVPTIADSLIGKTVLNFYDKQTSIRIDAIPYAVDVLEFSGKADFQGVFGLTGNFTGWFSNDEANVPIQATMTVALGSVNIELKEWHREGWNPPKRND